MGLVLRPMPSVVRIETNASVMTGRLMTGRLMTGGLLTSRLMTSHPITSHNVIIRTTFSSPDGARRPAPTFRGIRSADGERPDQIDRTGVS